MNQQSFKKFNSLAIVILNYCSANDVINNVNNLLSFNKPFHIVVVDNASPDGSFQRIRDYFGEKSHVDILQTGSNLGYASGNNFGIRYAMKTYDVQTIAIMNPDVVISSVEVIEKLCALLYWDEKCIFAGGSPLNHYSNDRPMPMGWDIPSASELVLNSCLFVDSADECKKKKFKHVHSGIYQCECVAGCFFVVKCSLFKEIEYYDEGTFLYNEENILGIKARQAGYHGLIDCDIKYYHNHPDKKKSISLQEKLNSIDSGFKSRVYLAKRYYTNLIVPFLYFAQVLNKVFLLLSWCKHRLNNRNKRDR